MKPNKINKPLLSKGFYKTFRRPCVCFPMSSMVLVKLKGRVGSTNYGMANSPLLNANLWIRPFYISQEIITTKIMSPWLLVVSQQALAEDSQLLLANYFSFESDTSSLSCQDT